MSKATVRRRLPAAARREVIEQAAIELFAARGYAGASMDEIARRSGVSVPVVYDHFASKLDLHRHLLERHRDELLAMWRENLAGEDADDVRVARALNAWVDYVEAHPYATQMFFRETTGGPEVRAVHHRVQEEARVALGEILSGEPGTQGLAGSGDPLALQMAAEIMRAGLTGLALWWTEHPEVPREQVLAAAINVLWIGFERVQRGEGVRAGGT